MWFQGVRLAVSTGLLASPTHIRQVSIIICSFASVSCVLFLSLLHENCCENDQEEDHALILFPLCKKDEYSCRMGADFFGATFW